MAPTGDGLENADAKGSGFARGVRKGIKVAALAAALVPLGSIPVTPTDPLIGAPRAAHAAAGDIVANIGIPVAAAAACDGPEGTTGTALASVPGGKAGFPDSRVLLVNSCVQTGESGAQINLLFIEPAFNGEDFSPTLRRSFATIFPSTASAASRPVNGWEAAVLRADKGDLLVCGRNGGSTVLWSIDFSPFNSTPDGTATFLRNGPNGSSCDSIAYDPSDGSVYQTPASGLGVFHSSNTGGALAPIVVPQVTACATLTGLGIAGTSLFVACTRSGEGSPPPSVAQLYKVDGSLTRQFNYSCSGACPPAPLTLRGVPDDPATFDGDVELLWTMTDNGQFVAFEMAGGTLGQRSGSPVLAPGSCPVALGGNTSPDGDGLLACWKNPGLWSDGRPGINYAGTYASGSSPATRDVTLCVNEASPTFSIANDCAKQGRPDLFLEIDYMNFHMPSTAAGSPVDAVVQMFKNAPNSNNRYPLPYTGIALHVQVDDLVTVNGQNHFTNLAFPPCTAPASSTDNTTVDFDAVKRLFFGTAAERASLSTKPNALNAKALVFRYALMAHNLLGLGTTSGCAEILGNDLVVSLGSWGTKTFGTGKTAVSHGVGTDDQLSGTLAHEFGHTLRLRHGGGDNVNCKSNYPSVMNYNHQFFNPTTRLLDYSRQALLTLDKTALVESLGVGTTYTGKIGYGPVPPLTALKVATAGGPIDWNGNGSFTDTDNLDLPQTTSVTGGCPANQKGAPGNDQGQFLFGFDDWANIEFSFRSSVDFADGGHITSGETALTTTQNGVPAGASPDITLETAAGLSSDATPIAIVVNKNNINPNADQDIQVAILSDKGFDATTIAPQTVRLQGLPPATWSISVKDVGQGALACSVKDQNKDGRPDLVCNFKIPQNTIGSNETEVLLTGVSVSNATPEGLPVAGTAPISVH